MKTGMIELGKFKVSLYPNSGIVIENHGGTMFFKGGCNIGNNSFISIGQTGHVVIGENVSCTSSLKLASYHKIYIEDNVLIGWNNTVMDTDFHRLKCTNGSLSPKSFDKIVIGEGTWIGANTIIMKGTIVPPFCVVASNSLLNKEYSCRKNSLLAGQPAKVIRTGIYMDRKDNKIDYGKFDE